MTEFEIQSPPSFLSFCEGLMAVPNGTPAGAPLSSTKLPKVIGINFGNSFASIAVISEVSQVPGVRVALITGLY